MALHDKIKKLREQEIEAGRQPVPSSLQGVDKPRIAAALAHIDRNHVDTVDAVFALLDNQRPSWFAKAPADLKFSDGASTAHIGCHVGILQRGRSKLDREGRDAWLKPLWEIGAMEKVLSTRTGFIDGHQIAKSPLSAYRLAESFAMILKTNDDSKRAEMLDQWTQQDAIRQRLQAQAEAVERARKLVDHKHSDLIDSAVSEYVPRFLEGYELLYVDETDDDRVTEEDKKRLKKAGIELSLADAMPDVLLWNPKSDRLWIIEAVTSDGEVDAYKVEQLTALAERFGKAGIDFTTAYPNWKKAAQRQTAHKNITPGTYIWIAEEPAKQLYVSA